MRFTDSASYMTIHQGTIERAVSDAVSGVLQECPNEPLRFMAEVLLRLSAASGPSHVYNSLGTAASAPPHNERPQSRLPTLSSQAAELGRTPSRGHQTPATEEKWGVSKWLSHLKVCDIVSAGILSAAGWTPASGSELDFVHGLRSRDHVLELLSKGRLAEGSAEATGPQVLERLADALWRGKQDLGVLASSMTPADLQAKFVLDDHAPLLEYAGLDIFFGGLEGRVRCEMAIPCMAADFCHRSWHGIAACARAHAARDGHQVGESASVRERAIGALPPLRSVGLTPKWRRPWPMSTRGRTATAPPSSTPPITTSPQHQISSGTLYTTRTSMSGAIPSSAGQSRSSCATSRQCSRSPPTRPAHAPSPHAQPTRPPLPPHQCSCWHRFLHTLTCVHFFAIRWQEDEQLAVHEGRTRMRAPTIWAAGARPRRPERLETLRAPREQRDAELRRLKESPLTEAEVVAARLYTGPLYVKYNAVLRGLGVAPCGLKWRCVGSHRPDGLELHHEGLKCALAAKLQATGVEGRIQPDDDPPTEREILELTSDEFEVFGLDLCSRHCLQVGKRGYYYAPATNDYLRNMMVSLCCSEADASRFFGGPRATWGSAMGSAKQESAFRMAIKSLNRYTTTLHAINSAIVRLGKLTPVTTVYRGINRFVLPEQFWKANRYNVKGGVESAFMSCTTDKTVAMQYAAGRGGSNGVGLVLECQQGMVSRGADISWLSQYKHEQEVLFAPLTGMEVQGTRIEGSTMVVSVNVSVNLAALTIDQVISKRKRLVADMVSQVREKVNDAVRLQWDANLAEALQAAHGVDAHAVVGRRLEAIMVPFAGRPAEYYNTDKHLGNAINDGLSAASSVSSWPHGLEALRKRVQDRVRLTDDSRLRDGKDGIVDLLTKAQTVDFLFEKVDAELVSGVAALVSLSRSLREVDLSRVDKWEVDGTASMEALASALTSCSLSESSLMTVKLPLPQFYLYRNISSMSIPVKLLVGAATDRTDPAECIDLRFERSSSLAGELIGRLIRCNTSLRSLDLRATAINGAGAESLARFVVDRAYVTDNMSMADGSPLESFGGIDLVGLRNPTSKMLDLSERLLGAPEAHVLSYALRALPTTSAMTFLDLRANLLDDASGHAILKALTASVASRVTLKHLDLSDNALGQRTGEAAHRLMRLAQALRSLYLDVVRLTPSVDLLQAYHQKLKLPGLADGSSNCPSRIEIRVSILCGVSPVEGVADQLVAALWAVRNACVQPAAGILQEEGHMLVEEDTYPGKTVLYQYALESPCVREVNSGLGDRRWVTAALPVGIRRVLESDDPFFELTNDRGEAIEIVDIINILGKAIVEQMGTPQKMGSMNDVLQRCLIKDVRVTRKRVLARSPFKLATPAANLRKGIRIQPTNWPMPLTKSETVSVLVDWLFEVAFKRSQEKARDWMKTQSSPTASHVQTIHFWQQYLASVLDKHSPPSSHADGNQSRQHAPASKGMASFFQGSGVQSLFARRSSTSSKPSSIMPPKKVTRKSQARADDSSTDHSGHAGTTEDGPSAGGGDANMATSPSSELAIEKALLDCVGDVRSLAVMFFHPTLLRVCELLYPMSNPKGGDCTPEALCKALVLLSCLAPLRDEVRQGFLSDRTDDRLLCSSQAMLNALFIVVDAAAEGSSDGLISLEDTKAVAREICTLIFAFATSALQMAAKTLRPSLALDSYVRLTKTEAEVPLPSVELFLARLQLSSLVGPSRECSSDEERGSQAGALRFEELFAEEPDTLQVLYIGPTGDTHLGTVIACLSAIAAVDITEIIQGNHRGTDASAGASSQIEPGAHPACAESIDERAAFVKSLMSSDLAQKGFEQASDVLFRAFLRVIQVFMDTHARQGTANERHARQGAANERQWSNSLMPGAQAAPTPPSPRILRTAGYDDMVQFCEAFSCANARQSYGQQESEIDLAVAAMKAVCDDAANALRAAELFEKFDEGAHLLASGVAIKCLAFLKQRISSRLNNPEAHRMIADLVFDVLWQGRKTPAASDGWTPPPQSSTMRKLRAIFDFLDADGSGTISPEELAKMAERLVTGFLKGAELLLGHVIKPLLDDLVNPCLEILHSVHKAVQSGKSNGSTYLSEQAIIGFTRCARARTDLNVPLIRVAPVSRCA